MICVAEHVLEGEAPLHHSSDGTGYLEIQSLECISMGQNLYVLIGLRDGHLMSAKIEGPTNSSPEFKKFKFTGLGTSQVEFISTTHLVNIEEDGVGVFVFCERLWEVTGRYGVLQINEVLFDAYRTVVFLLSI
jgi:hypothetical protein